MYSLCVCFYRPVDYVTKSVVSLWKKDNAVHGFTLPSPVFLQLIQLLVNNCKHMPKSQRYLNGFHVSIMIIQMEQFNKSYLYTSAHFCFLYGFFLLMFVCVCVCVCFVFLGRGGGYIRITLSPSVCLSVHISCKPNFNITV